MLENAIVTAPSAAQIRTFASRSSLCHIAVLG
jgi:hypothetical protein